MTAFVLKIRGMTFLLFLIKTIFVKFYISKNTHKNLFIHTARPNKPSKNFHYPYRQIHTSETPSAPHHPTASRFALILSTVFHLR